MATKKFWFFPDPCFHQSPQSGRISSLDWDDYDEMLAAQENCDAKASACPFIDYEAIEACGSDSEDNEIFVTVKSKRAHSKRLVSYGDSDHSNDVYRIVQKTWCWGYFVYCRSNMTILF